MTRLHRILGKCPSHEIGGKLSFETSLIAQRNRSGDVLLLKNSVRRKELRQRKVEAGQDVLAVKSIVFP